MNRFALGGLLLATVIGAVAPMAMAAQTKYVPDHYATIQAAIDALASGDTIIVRAGTYYTSIDFKGKSITLQSTDPTNRTTVQSTVINANQAVQVVRFATSETLGAVLNGFTIRNGQKGIYCEEASPTITNNIITGNTGAAVYLYSDASPVLQGNTITGNSGVGVLCDYRCSPSIVGNTINGNASSGIGADSYGCGPNIQGNTISGNTDTGITCRGGNITGNAIVGNSTSGYGAGIYAAGQPMIANNLIADNTASEYGGGICCTESPVIMNNTICDNASQGNRGGNIYIESGSPPIRNCIIAFAESGGGIYKDYGGSPIVSYCNVTGNVGGDYYGVSASSGPGNISVDPAFVNRSSAARDYHLKSTGGHWTAGGWVNDGLSSPCIDAGNPIDDYSFEPAPNGARINMGAYGNTSQASKTGLPVPRVLSWSPTGGDCNAQFPTVKVTFSMAMKKGSAQRAFSISPNPDAPGKFIWEGRTMRYHILGALKPSTTYNVRIGKDATSAVGTSMVADKNWPFSTTPRPAVGVAKPNGTAVSRNSIIRVGFNQPMKHTLTQDAFSLSPTRTGTFSWVGNEMRFAPDRALAWNTEYTATISTAARGTNNLNLTRKYSWTFRTEARSTSLAALDVAAAPTPVGAQISATLSVPAAVQVAVTNIAGRTVALLPERNLPAGTSTLLWNGRSTSGTKVPAGTYLFRVIVRTHEGSQSEAVTMARLR